MIGMFLGNIEGVYPWNSPNSGLFSHFGVFRNNIASFNS